MSSNNGQENTADQLFQASAQLRKQAAALREHDPNAAARLEARAEALDDGAIQNAIAASLEAFKTQNAKWLDEWRYNREWYRENDRSVIAFSQAAQRNLILVNAGAAVALLTFMGNLLAKGSDVSAFIAALTWFCTGVAAGTFTSVLAYITQLLYGSEDPKRVWWGKISHSGAIVVGMSTLLLFIGGCITSYEGFRSTNGSTNERQTMTPKDTPSKKNVPPPRQPPATPPSPPPAVPSNPPATPSSPLPAVPSSPVR